MDSLASWALPPTHIFDNLPSSSNVTAPWALLHTWNRDGLASVGFPACVPQRGIIILLVLVLEGLDMKGNKVFNFLFQSLPSFPECTKSPVLEWTAIFTIRNALLFNKTSILAPEASLEMV